METICALSTGNCGISVGKRLVSRSHVGLRSKGQGPTRVTRIGLCFLSDFFINQHLGAIREAFSVSPGPNSKVAVECDAHPFLVAKPAMPGDLVDVSIRFFE